MTKFYIKILNLLVINQQTTFEKMKNRELEFAFPSWETNVFCTFSFVLHQIVTDWLFNFPLHIWYRSYHSVQISVNEDIIFTMTIH